MKKVSCITRPCLGSYEERKWHPRPGLAIQETIFTVVVCPRPSRWCVSSFAMSSPALTLLLLRWQSSLRNKPTQPWLQRANSRLRRSKWSQALILAWMVRCAADMVLARDAEAIRVPLRYFTGMYACVFVVRFFRRRGSKCSAILFQLATASAQLEETGCPETKELLVRSARILRWTGVFYTVFRTTQIFGVIQSSVVYHSDSAAAAKLDSYSSNLTTIVYILNATAMVVGLVAFYQMQTLVYVLFGSCAVLWRALGYECERSTAGGSGPLCRLAALHALLLQAARSSRLLLAGLLFQWLPVILVLPLLATVELIVAFKVDLLALTCFTVIGTIFVPVCITGGGQFASPSDSWCAPGILLAIALLTWAVTCNADVLPTQAPAEGHPVTEHPAPVIAFSQKADSQNVSSTTKDDETNRAGDNLSQDGDGAGSGHFDCGSKDRVKFRSPHSRIVNGEDVEITEVPYQVALEYSSRFTCGGSVISEWWVLTAAHCFERPYQATASRWRVRLGTTYRQKGGRLLRVQRVARHPRYHGRGWDVALVSLADRAAFSSAVQPVRLSSRSDADPASGAAMTISGWGATQFESTFLPDKLKRAKVQIIDRRSCSAAYDEIHLGPVRLDELCAGGNKKDSCQGDSGGAMVDSSGVQVGIVSWGEGCATFPGVYTKVGSVDIRDFILKTSGV
ncbi:uncharacterized protein LOC113217032 [Frankliniella occidentalis]|uniref:Uncharacterized protein LOC113217032 n=1 Tax=Frankliniella occidentalis TaxID=133901 RepID=A0A9C6XSZ7_FRAOC|nr:uncharacterized protein LOC113217032 [Frankliniella occidentalis]